MKQAIFKASAIALATAAVLTLFTGKAQAQSGEITIGVTLSATGAAASLGISEKQANLPATQGVISVSKTGHSVHDSASRVLARIQDGVWRIVK